MTKREFKVGDRVSVHSGMWKGETGILHPHELDNNEWFCINGHSKGVHVDYITHADPVPVGYTGKLKDMDLREGDVVEYVGGGQFTIERIVEEWNSADYTLISRANTWTHSDQWNNWNLSKCDGSFNKIPDREYQTEKLGKTKQVAYRSRKFKKVEPVVTTRTNTLYCYGHSAEFETTLIDGVPDFTTSRLVNPSTPN